MLSSSRVLEEGKKGLQTEDFMHLLLSDLFNFLVGLLLDLHRL